MGARTKRLLALFLVICMAAALFSGCTENSKMVLDVNGKKVRKDDFMTHLFFVKYGLMSSNIASGQTSINSIFTLSEELLSTEISADMTFRDYLEALAKNSASAALIYRSEVSKHKLKLSETDNIEISGRKNEFIETLGGGSAFNAFLRANETNENAVTRYFTDMYYGELLFTLFAEGGEYDLTETEKAAAEENFYSGYITARHILLATIDLTTQMSLSESEKVQKKEKAEEALEKLRAGADFTQIHKEYSEVNDGDMTFTKGEMDESFETAAFALKVGEISGIVESAFGYHIVIRDELDRGQAANALDDARIEKYQNYIGALMENAKISDGKALSKLVID